MKQLHWLTVNFCMMAFLLGCEETETASFNKREIQPPKGQGASKQICTVIRNYAPFNITGRVQLKSRERVSFRLSKNESRKVCLSGTLYGGDTISFVLTNYLTLPLFSCYSRWDRSVDIYARKQGDSWVYRATCRK